MSEESLLTGQANTDAGSQPAATPAPVEGEEPKVEGQEGGAPQGQQPEGKKEGEEGKPEGAPESYNFELPEGYELNQEVADEFTAYAKELNLPQDKAQAAVGMGVKLVESFQAKQAEAFAAQQATWRDAVTNDKEIGGPALAENLSYAAKVLDTYAPDLRAVLDETGMGNHPALVKAFVKIGKAISEDRLVGGAQQTPGAAQDPAAKLFPNMNQ